MNIIGNNNYYDYDDDDDDIIIYRVTRRRDIVDYNYNYYQTNTYTKVTRPSVL